MRWKERNENRGWRGERDDNRGDGDKKLLTEG